MLVLSRKVGEQIVLPDCGVTISVVKVAGKKVRLGIVAPADAPVHRAEIWSRICQSDGSGRKSDRNPGGASLAPAKKSRPQAAAAVATEGRSELGERLVCTIAERTGGRIRALRVESTDENVVVHGRAASYYARQLAFAAVSEALHGLGQEGNEKVHLDIEVAGS
jgi:carbon storage regulator